ncbi:uncharacterized protein MELLADRAFT_124497 [Melampsora larici-populina 98AG31]|uniref:Candidate secreted effector protein MPL124497 n=1 Tax=Melampsora larici-populina (strain 98AG31 / pathotype 3-4-7) TaxID=747676 RepID=CSEPB_MELLP|nr:uncharacterized protein MELLADRAFT_124497 [Melampsora larici-populina 98AG31]F4RWV0.1 RecName: Full=Candidate secreted effector protein MPL124497; Short=CSEP MPL124497; AltName: Full=Small secreted protein MPL124497; Short=SSP MPL124497; Flags: Precursor [Melampsora larici-populina 98AG31]EGG03160.1 secreted protein [Melampsora larici-populina 98AG31]
MKLIIFAAISVAFMSFDQVLGSMLHGVKSEEAMMIADGSVVKPIDHGGPTTEPDGCQVCIAYNWGCSACQRKKNGK